MTEHLKFYLFALTITKKVSCCFLIHVVCNPENQNNQIPEHLPFQLKQDSVKMRFHDHYQLEAKVPQQPEQHWLFWTYTVCPTHLPPSIGMQCQHLWVDPTPKLQLPKGNVLLPGCFCPPSCISSAMDTPTCKAVKFPPPSPSQERQQTDATNRMDLLGHLH